MEEHLSLDIMSLVYRWWVGALTGAVLVTTLTTSTSLHHKTRSWCGRWNLIVEWQSEPGGCQELWLMSESVDNLVSKAAHNNLLVVISPPALPLVRTPSSHFIGPIRAENVSRNLSWTLAQICFIVCLLHFTHVSIGKESSSVNWNDLRLLPQVCGYYCNFS